MIDRTITSRSGQTLTVRRLAGRDVNALQSFHQELSPETRSRFTPHAYEDAIIAVYVRRNEQGKDLIYVLETGDREIVGYFFLWEFKDPVPLLGIGLADAMQGEGLGKTMMEILIAEAQAAGCDGIELTTFPDNERAFRLYLSVGFNEIGMVENITGDGRKVIERKMFLPLKEGAKPTEREFKPPA
ncbi:MAG: GNAT family N-acetyltransferase [Limisphaerales bacterium]